MANPVTYQRQTVYLSAVLETEPSFMSGRILEVEAWLCTLATIGAFSNESKVSEYSLLCKIEK
jgi:hypothetical protein